jgi:hypothetical protein
VAEHKYDDQQYELVAIKPHVCRNGVRTEILVWRTRCIDCGGECEVTTRKKN